MGVYNIDNDGGTPVSGSDRVSIHM